MKQDELGRLLRRMVPPVDETGVWGSIEQRTGCEQTNAVSPGLASDEPHFAGNARPIRPRRIHTRRRLIGLAAVTAIVLVAVGFGINALIEQLGQRDSVIVFSDGSMSPGGTGQGSLDPAGAQGTTLTGAKAELWAEIQRIREGVNSGELSFGWNASEAAGGDLPSDPMLMLDSLEESLLRSDVTVYYLGGDSAGDASALQTEVSAMPGVVRFEFVSKDDALERLKNDFADNPEILEGLQENPLPASLEVWLTDYTQAPSLADELRGRPEVDEVVLAPTMDYAQWVERLRSLTREVSADGGKALVANPYPFPTVSSGVTGEQPSTWAEDLGKAVLDFYPKKDWKVFRAVELEGAVMRLTIAPASGKAAPGSWPTDVARLSISIRREESGQISQDTDSGQHLEFETAYGHGLILPRYSDGERSSIVSWFVRPDKLMIQVAVSQPSAPDVSADLGLDEQGVQELLTYVASIIEMAEAASMQETTTTSARAEAAGSPPASGPTSTQAPSGPTLRWGETASPEGRMVTVTKPAEDTNASGAHPGWKAYYCTVTITNTGDDPLNYTASEFTLEGNSSGSVGIGAPGIVGDSSPTVGGEPLLKAGTLEPGRSITAAVRFSLDGKDVPVKVRLGTATSTAVTLASWQSPGSPAAVGDWPVNARGQTYGSNIDVGPENEPDLILVQATNGKTGYSLKTDLDGPMPKTPEEALAWQEARRGQPPREIPVYLSDGVTKIGVFLISP